jgi:DNA-binding transcriptional MerR regulator
VNVGTLRYYERRGLLPHADRTPSGHRRYGEETVRLLGAIKEAEAVGYTLAEIADYLGAARRSTAPSEALRVRMAAKIDQIDARIAALRRMRDELARVVGCACTSLDHCTCGAAYLARRGGAPTSRPSLLHVTNGESAGNTLRQTALGGAVLPWQDALHEGPVPALPRHELRRTRARFLADCGWGGRQALLSSLERRDGQLLEALRDHLQVVLWFEHDLSRPRSGGCSRSCPRRQTGSRRRSDGRSTRSPPARKHLPPPSSPYNDSRSRPSSATPGSTAPSRRSGRERRGFWAPATARHFPRLPRSATTGGSHASGCA